MLRRTGFKKKTYERPPIPPPTRGRLVPMAVIKDEVLVAPKDPRYEDRHLLSMARGKPCLLQSLLCNHNPETTVACHGAGVSAGKGMGYKVGDHLTCWGCHMCNHFTDAYGGATKSEKAAVFAAGHERQVDAWRSIAADQAAPARDRASAQAALDRIAADGARRVRQHQLLPR